MLVELRTASFSCEAFWNSECCAECSDLDGGPLGRRTGGLGPGEGLVEVEVLALSIERRLEEVLDTELGDLEALVWVLITVREEGLLTEGAL